jgi:ABC transport system ATP-binding/permease protein
MAIFSAQDLSLNFGDVALLDKASFSIQENERIGLIGRNGTGKSSLLKIVTGVIKPDDGELKQQNGMYSAYVPQESLFPNCKTVFDAMASQISDYALLLEYDELISIDYSNMQDVNLQKTAARLEYVQNYIEERKIWDLAYRINTMLEQIGLDPARELTGLSGGEKKRISIASSLIKSPDILLLDEPTNHLDINGIAWLENILTNFKGSVVLISHDRYFLDKVCTRIIELDRATLTSFEGNFAYYTEKKAELLQMEIVENAKFDKLMSQEEVWIRKGVEARRTKSVARIERLKQMRQSYQDRRTSQGNIKLEVSQGEQSGKIVAELTNVGKKYDAKVIAQELNLTIMRGDKVGIIGNNGVGKSTLVKILLGKINPDSGKIKLGSNLQIAYFDQMREQLDEKQTLAYTISPGSEWIEINGRKKHVISYLNDFLFNPERAQTVVSSLSGGERNRLLLARLFAMPSNVLVLDEPTNDLDIQTLELLEEKIDEYAGTVLLISHDRYFLDNIVNYIIAPDFTKHTHGAWRSYIGGYADWQRQTAADVNVNNMNKAKSKNNNNNNKANINLQANISASTKPAIKLSYKDQRELEMLPKLIEQMEQEQKEIELKLEGLYASNPQEANILSERYAKLEQDLLQALDKWEKLEG